MMIWVCNGLAVQDFSPVLADNWWEKPGPLGIPMGMFLLFCMFLHNQRQRQNQQAQSPSAETSPAPIKTKKKKRPPKKTAQHKQADPKKRKNPFAPPKVAGHRCSKCGGEVKDWNGNPRCLACGTLYAKQ